MQQEENSTSTVKVPSIFLRSVWFDVLRNFWNFKIAWNEAIDVILNISYTCVNVSHKFAYSCIYLLYRTLVLPKDILRLHPVYLHGICVCLLQDLSRECFVAVSLSVPVIALLWFTCSQPTLLSCLVICTVHLYLCLLLSCWIPGKCTWVPHRAWERGMVG